MKKLARQTLKNSVNVATLKAKLSEYLGRARNGDEVIVTDHKLPVARLIPFAVTPDGGFVAQAPRLPLSHLLKMTESLGAVVEDFSSLDSLLEDRMKR